MGSYRGPGTEWMSLDALLSLLRSGTCRSRCYAKQVPIDLYLPSLLKSLHPPRFFRDELGGKSVPLTQANLWLGSNTPGQPLLTGLHKDAQPNLVAMIAGRKQVFVVPPSETHLLMPVKLLDVQSSRSVDGTLFPGAPILPTQLDGALVDTQHFMMSVEQLKGQLHPTFTETTFPSPNMRLSLLCARSASKRRMPFSFLRVMLMQSRRRLPPLHQTLLLPSISSTLHDRGIVLART